MKLVFTTGQIAKICKVAPRTVSKWFDTGKIIGYRIPGCLDRRVTRDNLILFLKQNNMPLWELQDPKSFKTLFIGVSKLAEELFSKHLLENYCLTVSASSVITGAVELVQVKPDLLIIDGSVGKGGIEEFNTSLAELTKKEKGQRTPQCVALLSDYTQEDIDWCEKRGIGVLRLPVDIPTIGSRVFKIKEEKFRIDNLCHPSMRESNGKNGAAKPNRKKQPVHQNGSLNEGPEASGEGLLRDSGRAYEETTGRTDS